MRPPQYARRFADALLATRVDQLEVPGTRPPVHGVRGILTTTKLQYATETWQLLGREHEYMFWLPGPQPVSVSLQLYLNLTDHWRLFAYSERGMLFSVNLTRLRDGSDTLAVSQTIRLATRGWSTGTRAKQARAMVAALRQVGFEVDDNHRIVLGTFDTARGKFVDTSTRAFVRDFVLAALIKGHFMANKGYELPLRARGARQPPPERSKRAAERSVPLGLRYQVLLRDKSRCRRCGSTVKDGVRLHVDHVLPWSRGGRTELKNLQTLCAPCNLGKGNRATR